MSPGGIPYTTHYSHSQNHQKDFFKDEQLAVLRRSCVARAAAVACSCLAVCMDLATVSSPALGRALGPRRRARRPHAPRPRSRPRLVTCASKCTCRRVLAHTVRPPNIGQHPHALQRRQAKIRLGECVQTRTLCPISNFASMDLDGAASSSAVPDHFCARCAQAGGVFLNDLCAGAET